MDKTNLFSAHRLDAVRVYGEQPGERTYTREQIAETPSSNRDLTSLVASHPAVRVNAGANGSQNRGSLDVEDLSFHGASPYQNLFQLDGMDATNRLDPASKNLNLQVGNIPSNSQSYFVDTSLLEEVRVYDSFVPAEYGRFTGGVVDARLRRYSGENHLSLDYRWNTSKMTQQKVAEGEEASWAQGKPGYAPEWKSASTPAWRIWLSTKSPARSWRYRVANPTSRAGTWAWTAGPAAARPGQLSRPNRQFPGQVQRARQRADHGRPGAQIQRPQGNTGQQPLPRNPLGQQPCGARHQRQHRPPVPGRALFAAGRLGPRAQQPRIGRRRAGHFPARGLPQYTAGGFGKEQKQQDSWTLKGRVDLDPVRTGAITHIPYAGLEWQRVQAGFERFQQSHSYRRAYDNKGGYQDFSKVRYLPGTVDVNYDSVSAYLSDRIEWERLALDAGVRYDRESFLGTNNISPRSRLDWDVLGSGDTLLSAGWSRYYGSEVLQTALEEEINRMRRQVLDAKGRPVTDGTREYYVRYQGLRMPYDDEWAMSLRQRLAGIEGTLSYVHRNGRDQWTKAGNDTDGYRYTNDGRSTTDGVSLTLRPLEPWRLGETRWNLLATWSWQKRKTNGDLVKGYSGDARDPDDQVIYNNAQIRAMDLPPSNFHQPQEAVLHLIGALPKAGLTWSNKLHWRSKRDATIYVGVGPKPLYLQRYESGNLPSYWTWDTKLAWRPTFARNLEISAEVLNVLDSKPALTASNPNLKSSRALYQVGREIWLQVGYRY